MLRSRPNSSVAISKVQVRPTLHGECRESGGWGTADLHKNAEGFLSCCIRTPTVQVNDQALQIICFISGEATLKITVSSDPQEATLSVGDTRKFDVSDSGFYDVSVTLNSIIYGKADLTILSISEEVTVESEAEQTGAEEEAVEEAAGEEPVVVEGSQVWIWIIVIVVVLIIVGVIVVKKKKK